MPEWQDRIRSAEADGKLGQVLKNMARWAAIGSDSPKQQPNHATWHN